MFHRADPEVLGDRLTEIGKCPPRSEIDASFHLRSRHQQRHMLARVIGARRRRIVTMIGGQDEQVVVSQARQEILQPGVEALEIRRVAGDIVPMPVQPCRSRQGSRRSGRRAVDAISDMMASIPVSSLVVWSARLIPRPANRSSIFPMAIVGTCADAGDRAPSRSSGASRSPSGWPSA